MSLQLVYRYYSSLSKNENMFKQSKLRKQKQSEKKRNSFRRVYLLRHGIKSENKLVKLTIFNVFAHEILPETLFEADRALFMNRKTGRVLPVKVVLKLISSHLKWPTKQNHREVSC